ncbi:hypothetical protein [Streptomyces sp. Z26]|uniref:hypothetical protein n=1 Tax=Streptomyces sp. Z26 TaxID=2500177 RepID=UPI000EF143E9|nr:hypothetical protein [Streptomyces sp. Z26]RLL68155.1 hypothetical protein D7M15_16370 [Streptomyces sp. Z26]
MSDQTTSLRAITGPPLVPLNVDRECDMAHDTLAEHSGADIHDPEAMVRAAVALSMRLDALLRAVEAAGGGR